MFAIYTHVSVEYTTLVSIAIDITHRLTKNRVIVIDHIN